MRHEKRIDEYSANIIDGELGGAKQWFSERRTGRRGRTVFSI